MAETNVQYLDMEGLQLYNSLIKSKIANDIAANKYDDTALKNKVIANENAIADLQTKVNTLENTTFTPITEDEINSMFNA